jgi:hypothetical protein
MGQRLADMSSEELENLVSRTVDRRLQVWLQQVLDAMGDADDETELKPEFADGLRRSLEQVRNGQVLDLDAFREQIGR